MTCIVAVSGYKNSGKTTLCRKLLRELSALGLSVGYIKYTSENALQSEKDSDTGSVLDMGIPSILWGKDGVMFEERSDGEEFDLATIVAKSIPDKVLLLVEGCKNLTLPKVWVASEAEENPNYPGIFLTYDRHGGADGNVRFGEGEEDKIVSKLYDLAISSSHGSTRVYIGNKLLPMKRFVADFVGGGIVGMLGSLKKTENLGDKIKVYIDTNMMPKD